MTETRGGRQSLFASLTGCLLLEQEAELSTMVTRLSSMMPSTTNHRLLIGTTSSGRDDWLRALSVGDDTEEEPAE